MTVLLVQHGVAKSKDEDPERSLSDTGTLDTKKMAAWLSRQSIIIDEILHSGKKRAAQTADIFASHLSPGKGVTAVSGLNPNDDVQAFAENMLENDEVRMVVGHLPFLEKLAGLLVGGSQDAGVVSFVNSGVVCLKQNQGEWTLGWAVTPELVIE